MAKGSDEMFDNMTGTVGFAMHEDRLATATRNLRLAEAERGAKGQRGNDRRTYRATIASALVVLATRIAPHGTPGKVATAQ
jgi:hypothetical protein